MIAIVPIRSGSKAIKNKNIKLFDGKPLVWWILNSLERSSINKIIVALDLPYFNIVNEFHFKKVDIYIRNKKNSRDESSSEDVLIEVIKKFNLDDDILLAQATSPLTDSRDFEKGINLYNESNFESILSVVKLDRFVWNKNGTPLNYNYKKRPRRQEFEGTYFENGAFYINHSYNILKYKNRLSGKIGFSEMSFKNFFELDNQSDWDLINHLKKIG